MNLYDLLLPELLFHVTLHKRQMFFLTYIFPDTLA